MTNIIDRKFNTFTGENKQKNKIFLTHTSRNAEEYLTALKYRHFGKYNKIPNYVITKEGYVLQTLDDEKYSEYIGLKSFDKESIIISLENLGWLEKEPLKNHHINWIGSIYSENVFEKKWREKFFWDPYTDKQIESLVYLCKILVEKHSIENKCVGHNTKINIMESFNGIMTKSNIDENSTDLSPAFDFNEFVKKLKDE